MLSQILMKWGINLNIEEMKELAKEVSQVTRNLEIMESYMSLLGNLIHKEETTQDKAMALYFALESDGMLQLLRDQLEDMVSISNEADNFIYKVAEELETKKLVSNHGGSHL